MPFGACTTWQQVPPADPQSPVTEPNSRPAGKGPHPVHVALAHFAGRDLHAPPLVVDPVVLEKELAGLGVEVDHLWGDEKGGGGEVGGEGEGWAAARPATCMLLSTHMSPGRPVRPAGAYSRRELVST